MRKGNFGSILPNAKENKEELEVHQPQIHSQFHSQSVRIIRGADGVRGRSQFSTFSQAYTQYTRGEGVNSTFLDILNVDRNFHYEIHFVKKDCHSESVYVAGSKTDCHSI